MNLASLILSIVGVVISIAGVIASLWIFFKTTKSTREDVEEIKKNVDVQTSLIIKMEFEKELSAFSEWLMMKKQEVENLYIENLSSKKLGRGLIHFKKINSFQISLNHRIDKLKNISNKLSLREKDLVESIKALDVVLNGIIRNAEIAAEFSSPFQEQLKPFLKKHNPLSVQGTLTTYLELVNFSIKEYFDGKNNSTKNLIEEFNNDFVLYSIVIENEYPTNFKNNIEIIVLRGTIIGISLFVGRSNPGFIKGYGQDGTLVQPNVATIEANQTEK